MDDTDYGIWVHDLKNTWIGDANLDLKFNSSDMVAAFAAGGYEKGQRTDAGTFVPEPSSLLLLWIGATCWVITASSRVRSRR